MPRDAALRHGKVTYQADGGRLRSAGATRPTPRPQHPRPQRHGYLSVVTVLARHAAGTTMPDSART